MAILASDIIHCESCCDKPVGQCREQLLDPNSVAATAAGERPVAAKAIVGKYVPFVSSTREDSGARPSLGFLVKTHIGHTLYAPVAGGTPDAHGWHGWHRLHGLHGLHVCATHLTLKTDSHAALELLLVATCAVATACACRFVCTLCVYACGLHGR